MGSDGALGTFAYDGRSPMQPTAPSDTPFLTPTRGDPR